MGSWVRSISTIQLECTIDPHASLCSASNIALSTLNNAGTGSSLFMTFMFGALNSQASINDRTGAGV